jgi:outer membrane protein assembly factor BamB
MDIAHRWSLAGCFVCLWAGATVAADWPTYRHDPHRSGATTEELKLPLAEAWMHRPAKPPAPAWPELPAQQDVWHRVHGLSPSTTYDRVYHVVVADGRLYYGSSADDAVYCLDAARGAPCWSFTTEGPVRLAPTVFEGRVYAGSDDGNLYCLDAQAGQLKWKVRAAAEDRRLPGNGRIVSLWPIRCGLVAEAGQIYFGAGLFPEQGTFLCALRAADGKRVWRESVDTSMQGYLVASPARLYVPTGRTAPCACERSTGKPLGPLTGAGPDSHAGGCFAVLVDDQLIHSSGEQWGLQLTHAGEKLALVDGLCLVAQGSMSYVLTREQLCAIDRGHWLELTRLQAKRQKTAADRKRIEELGGSAKRYVRWEIPCRDSYDLILAGSTLFVGGSDTVTAYSTVDGTRRWAGSVAGKVYGLAVSDGSLLASTDKGTIYCFRSGKSKPPPPYYVESRHDAPPPIADRRTPLYAQAAEAVIRAAGVQKGYCLVLGAGEGRLALEIARRTQFHVIGLEPDAAKIAAGRKMLTAAGLYATRVTLHHGPLDRLPYQKYFANLVTSEQWLLEGKLATPASEVLRVLRPCGGTVALLTTAPGQTERLQAWGAGKIPGWKVLARADRATIGLAQRGPLPGAGRWDHFYGEPGNTASSGDQLPLGPVEVQWFGRPGPRRMVDRHDKNTAPVYRDGRLFVSGDNYIAGVDAYNGTILWERDVPNSVRLGAFKNAGNMAAADDLLYVASGSECLALDAQTGRLRLAVTTPADRLGRDHEWAYVAVIDDLLLGSASRTGAAFRAQTIDTEVLIWRDFMPVVTSDALFAHQRHTGSPAWHYEPASGVIINPTIAAGAGRVYFVESENPATREVADSRVKLESLFAQGAALVALDVRTGRVLWRRTVDFRNLQHIIYLSYAKEILLVTGTKNVKVDKQERVRYDFAAFDARSGKPLWQTTQTPIPDHIIQGGHGEQVQHPAIVGDVIYTTGIACRLQTGEPIDGWKWQKSGNCGILSASAHCLFSRYSLPRMFDAKSGEFLDLTKAARPGCWINMIPAGGLIMMAEASAGCLCGYPLQTSLALVPAD